MPAHPEVSISTKDSIAAGIDVSRDAPDIRIHPTGEDWRGDHRTDDLLEMVEILLACGQE